MKDLSFEFDRPVCFFDSGIGGLTLLGECVKRLPQTKFMYFSDNDNVPYGSLSKARLIEIADMQFEKIKAFNPCAAVIACNTVTATCARFLRLKYKFPIVGIQPAVKVAAEQREKCVVLATPATAASDSVLNLIVRFGNGITEVAPCRELAAFIENNIFNLQEAEIAKLLPDITADSVVLGCTHYVYAKEIIKRRYGCPVYDGIEGTANRLCSVLGRGNRFPQENAFKNASVEFIGGDTDKNKRVFMEIIPNL